MNFKDTGRIKVFFNNPHKKSYFKMGKEVLELWITKKEVPLYYFKHLYKKNVKNHRDYLGTREVARIHASKKLHKYEYTSILRNKLNFALYCEKNGVSTPKLVGHNFGRSFFFGNSIREIVNSTDLIQFYTEVFDFTSAAAIFFRPLALNQGQGCLMLEREKFSQQLKSQYENLVSGDYIHTETIKQHQQISAIYGKSINTLRILTIIENGEVDIISSLLRIGAGGSFVDNISSGGLYVGIDQENGTLNHKGYRDMKFGGEELEKHPDTGFKFENFKIPYFKEACQLVKNTTKQIPNGFIGWDVAVTPTGPTIIEGNEDAGFFSSDVAYGGLLKNPYMKKLMARIK